MAVRQSAMASSRSISFSLYETMSGDCACSSFGSASFSTRSLAQVAGTVRAAAEISSSSLSSVFMFPLLLELSLGRERDPLRVGLADAGDLADLGVAEAFDLEEDEDGAALLRQLAEEPRQHDPFRVVDVGGRVRQRHQVVDRRFPRPPAAAAHGVVAGVDEDAVEPRAEGRFAGV